MLRGISYVLKEDCSGVTKVKCLQNSVISLEFYKTELFLITAYVCERVQMQGHKIFYYKKLYKKCQ